MDLTIKAKTFELEALDFLDERAPEMYKGKKHGFYWAAHEAELSKDDIDWKKVAKVRLEHYFTGELYEGKVPAITHLTIEEDDYSSLAHTMEKQFELKRPVQKAYCARNVIKWAIISYYSDSMVTSQQRVETTVMNRTIEDFLNLSVDKKLNVLYKEIIEVKKMLTKDQMTFSGIFDLRGDITMKKRKLKVLEWNMNFSSNDMAEPAAFVLRFIKGFDVVILTEVRENVFLTKMIEDMKDYDFICSEEQGEHSNQIIILARKSLNLSKVAGCLEQDAKTLPDFLHGCIIVGGKVVNLLGVRVKIGSGIPFTDRFEQFKNMKKYIDSLAGESVICAGDFNSGQIRGKSDDKYSDVEVLYKYQNNKTELSNLRFYNFHLIKEELGDEYTLREIMGEDNSWGLTERNGTLLYGLGSRVKNDLLFYSKDIEGNGKYSWDHVRENEGEYLNMIARNYRKRDNKIDYGYPDHARLIAELYV